MPENDIAWPHGQALLDEIAQTSTASGSLALWHLGQSGFAVNGGSTTLLFDPFLMPSNERLKRTWEPPFAAENAAGVDYVFCSHDHLDHLDPYAVKGIALASTTAHFIVPPSAVNKLAEMGIAPERVHPAEVDKTVQYSRQARHEGALQNGAISVHAVPAAHGDSAKPTAEYLWEPHPERGYRFVGFVVDCNGVRLYHAGDTTIYPGMIDRLSALQIDVALLPINGRDWFREQRQIIGNMDYREASDLGHAIGAKVVVPMHYDMFSGNPGSPGAFAEYSVQQYPEQQIHIPARCRRWVFVR